MRGLICSCSSCAQTVIDRGAVLRGDLAPVAVDQYCYVGKRAVLRPAWRLEAAPPSDAAAAGCGGGPAAGDPGAGEGVGKKALAVAWSRLTVGSHVVIGSDAVVEALAVGSFVRIGAGAILGRHCVVKDCTLVLPGAVVPPCMVVPPFAMVGGCPARVLGELPESAAEEHKLSAEAFCRRHDFRRVASASQRS